MARPATFPRSSRGNIRRRLSQNFLTDPQVAERLVRLSGVGDDDRVIEIGPGDGIVTDRLARRCRSVLAYELDTRLARRINDRYLDNPRVRCLHQDFLTAHPPHHEFAVVANIPYSRTSAIVDWCLAADGLTSATMLTQLEYARKRCGDYGRWSRTTVASWPVFDWRLWGRVDRVKFHPIPKVDSGILRLVRRGAPLLPEWALADYRDFVALGFTGVGGSLHASLRLRFTKRAVANAFDQTGLNRRIVVGYVTPWDWLDLFRRVMRL